MVCKKCGADLKPGVKYCLNCGNYLDEDDEDDNQNEEGSDLKVEDVNNSSSDGADIKFDFENDELLDDSSNVDDTPKKKKKFKISTTDIVIYGVLSLIIVVSLIVMVLSIVNGNKRTNVNPTPTSTNVSDTVVEMSNYSIKFSGKLSYNQSGEVVYISDDKNFNFSYRNSLDDYERYAKNLSILESSLKKSGYTVLNSEKREVGSNEFIIYKFKDDGTVKYLYVTKVNNKYITMGTIEIVEDGDWKEALTVINSINKNIVFEDEEVSEDEISKVVESASSDLSKIIR